MGFKTVGLLMSIIVCLIPLNSSQEVENPVVTIPQGRLQGNFAISRDGREFMEFRAVSYGEIARRFDIAIPAGNWDGIRNATVSSPGCWTPYGSGGLGGVEDCLDLDVSTPMLPTDPSFQAPMPVMVWIYGGGFISGSAYTYGSKYFMDEDVVFIAINFRLGAFGLLNAGIEGASGNQALKDQVLALKWIQNNIANFGGDPARVTIFGESSGGGSVSLLTLSSMARGLFFGAIMQSGVAPLPQYFHGNQGVKNAKLLAAELDCPTRNVENMVDCLRNVSAEELTNSSTFNLNDLNWFTRDGIHLSLTVETFSKGPDDPNVFLSENPYEIAQRGEFARVPMIIGQIAQENFAAVMGSLSDPKFVEGLNAQFGRVMSENFYYDQTAKDPCVMTGKLKEFYLNGQNVSLENAMEFERLQTDRLMTHATRKMAEEYAKFNDVFMFNFTKSKAIDGLPPSHADDLHFMFKFFPEMADFPEIKPGDLDYEFSKNLIKAFASFARDGKPGRWGSTETEWTPLIPGQPQEWLQLGDDVVMKVVDQQFLDSWKFWDTLELQGPGEVSG